MKKRKKVFLLGIDGFDFQVFLPFLKQGKLPNFRKLLTKGLAKPLTSTLPPHSAPAWTSMITGVKPEKHGITYFHKLDGDTITPLSRYDRKYPAIWELLSERDLRSIVMNVPMTFPPEKINGIFLSGTIQVPTGRVYVYPKRLQEKITESDYVLYPQNLQQAKIHPKIFGKKLALVSWKRAKLALEFMETYDWDFFMLVLRAFDVLIHTIYPLILSSDHPYFDKVNYKLFRQVFLDYCCALDNILGKILKKLDKNTMLLIASDHGCAPIYKYLYPAPLLQKLGLLEVKQKNREEKLSKTKEIFKEKLYDVLGKTNLLTTAWLRYYHLRELLGQNLKLSKGKSYLSSVDLVNSKVIPYGHQTLVVKGKNESEARKIAQKVQELFTTLIDPATKERPVMRVKKIREPQGKDRGNYQVFLEMTDIYEVNKLIRGTMFRKSFKGKHSKKGIFIALGQEFNKKKQSLKEHFNCWDISPTILTLFGFPVPNWMEGQSLTSTESEKK